MRRQTAPRTALKIAMAFGLCLACLPAGAAEAPASGVKIAHPGSLLVTPNGPSDGGDFGPGTEGTRTSGIQEALNAAKAQRRDVYIAGGAMPKAFEGGAVYNLQETLRVPWMQDFRLDGGEYVIQYGPQTGDAVVFDSLMSCHIKLGLVVANTDGAVVRIRPETKGPDNFAVATATTLEINALVGGGSVFPGEGVRGKGIGLWLDAANGPILYNTIKVAENIACDRGVLATGVCIDNRMAFAFAHLCNVHFELGAREGDVFERNRLSTSINSENIKDARGLLLGGANNLLDLAFSPADRGHNLTFTASAHDNRVTVLNLPGRVDNQATTPTNLLVAASSAVLTAETPPLPASGEVLVQRQPFSVEALIIAPGVVTAWRLQPVGQPEQVFKGPIFSGQAIRLAPGDRLAIDYGQPPAWRWRVLP